MIARLARSMPFLVHVMAGGGAEMQQFISVVRPQLWWSRSSLSHLQAPDLVFLESSISLINLWTSVIKIIHLKPWIKYPVFPQSSISAVDSLYSLMPFKFTAATLKGIFWPILRSVTVNSLFLIVALVCLSTTDQCLLLHFKNISYDMLPATSYMGLVQAKLMLCLVVSVRGAEGGPGVSVERRILYIKEAMRFVFLICKIHSGIDCCSLSTLTEAALCNLRSSDIIRWHCVFWSCYLYYFKS